MERNRKLDNDKLSKEDVSKKMKHLGEVKNIIINFHVRQRVNDSTVWKFQDFSVTEILHEIKIGKHTV